MSAAICGRCSAIIHWAKRHDGSSVPLNHEASPTGIVTIEKTLQGLVATIHSESTLAEIAPGVPRYSIHPTDCTPAKRRRHR